MGPAGVRRPRSPNCGLAPSSYCNVGKPLWGLEPPVLHRHSEGTGQAVNVRGTRAGWKSLKRHIDVLEPLLVLRVCPQFCILLAYGAEVAFTQVPSFTERWDNLNFFFQFPAQSTSDTIPALWFLNVATPVVRWICVSQRGARGEVGGPPHVMGLA